jgi:hypothetical protein
MIAGTIRSIDHAGRTAVVLTADGREVSVYIPLNTHIEVNEPASGGMMGGTLEDIGVGHQVSLDVKEGADAVASQCINLVSIS